MQYLQIIRSDLNKNMQNSEKLIFQTKNKQLQGFLPQSWLFLYCTVASVLIIIKEKQRT